MARGYRRIIVGTGAALLLAAIGGSAGAQSIAQTVAPHATTDYGLLALLVSALATIVLIWSIRESRKIAILGQRAYVRAEPAPGGVVQPLRLVSIPMSLVNYGHTPARNVSVVSAMVVRPIDWKWPKDLESGDAVHESAAITLHPGVPFTIRVEMGDPLPEAVHRAIIEGQSAVFARGRVTYQDVFGRSRQTSFQIEFHGVDGAIRIAATGNEAD